VAEDDLAEIVNYPSGFSRDIAVRYYEEIRGKVLSLQHMPERCPFVCDEELRRKGYRWLQIRNYIVFFVIEYDISSIVDIRRILYSKRDYIALL
jgi:plasmid stabilization system protein ParE